jgi:hypothetical protein
MSSPGNTSLSLHGDAPAAGACVQNPGSVRKYQIVILKKKIWDFTKEKKYSFCLLHAVFAI